jgi:hypothetical protein
MTFCKFLMLVLTALCCVSCASSRIETDHLLADDANFYDYYEVMLERVLPMDLYSGDVTLRRYDTYARTENPLEFVASLSVRTEGSEQVIRARLRRFDGENLYMQLAKIVDDSSTALDLESGLRWVEYETDSLQCPELGDLWSELKGFQFATPSDLPDPVAPVSEGGYEEVVMIVHARMFELKFEVEDQMVKISGQSGPAFLADWVSNSFSILESCIDR